jgi:hypothetical protein
MWAQWPADSLRVSVVNDLGSSVDEFSGRVSRVQRRGRIDRIAEHQRSTFAGEDGQWCYLRAAPT